MSEAATPDELPRAHATETPPGPPHTIRWTLGRAEWLATEWPAVLVWGGIAGALAVPLAVGVRHSPWWLALVPVWFVLGGSKAIGIVRFLARGAERIELTVECDGVMLLSTDGSEPVHAWWTSFVNQGDSFLLRGADGRYRVVIPRRALTRRDVDEIAVRVGVDLRRLRPGAEARVRPIREESRP